MKTINIVKASKRIIDYLKINGVPVCNTDRKIIMEILKKVRMESAK
jgi:hypothetical protein